MANKTIFMMEAEPFRICGPDEEVSKFISERELVEETPTHYVVASLVSPDAVVEFSRRECVAFDTRDEALIHLERIVLNKVQELEDELSKWQQFTRSIEVEIMKP